MTNQQSRSGNLKGFAQSGTTVHAAPPGVCGKVYEWFRASFTPVSMVAGKPVISDVAWPLLTALALTLTFVTIPQSLGVELDASWCAVLGYAHEKGLQFGKDIVFTYGPMGFLTVPYFLAHAIGARLVIDVALCFTVAAGVCLLAWRLGLTWRCLLIAFFLVLSPHTRIGADGLISIGLLCWGLLCIVEPRPRLGVYVVIFALLAAFAGLTKVNLLVSALLSGCVLAGDLMLRGQRKAAATLVLCSSLSVILLCMLLGQRVSQLFPYLTTGLEISKGYDQTMASEAFTTRVNLGAALAALFGMALAIWRSVTAFSRSDRYIKWRRILLAGWLVMLLFIAWKHGFVRQGREHLEVLLGFVSMLALALEVLPSMAARPRIWARGLGVACCSIALFTLDSIFVRYWKSCLTGPFVRAYENVLSLTHPNEYRRKMSDLVEIQRGATRLPRLRQVVGQASVDVFGHHQSYALLNGLNYRPRPIFQSYVAYSAPLMRLNEQFYFSEAAPEYVLFRLLPVDERFPPLEDAWLFRDLLMNYQPVEVESPFLLLRSKPAHTVPDVTLLREGAVHPGELINLKAYGEAALWMEIEVEPTVLGRARRLVFRPPGLQLRVWRDRPTVQTARFQAPAPMLAAGFLANPLVLDDEDMLNLYTGSSIARPTAYSVELEAGSKPFWSDIVRYRIYKIENQIGHCASPELTKLLKFPGFRAAPAEVVSPTNTIARLEGRPALLLKPGSYMRFDVPAGAQWVTGGYGFTPAAYLLGGATAGAEFRIEEELPDGTVQVLHSRTLTPRTNPEDRGLKRFAIPLSSEPGRKLAMRSISLPGGNPKWDLTCWAEIGFN